MPTETPTPPTTPTETTTTPTPDVPNTDLKTIYESSPNPSKQLPPPEARTREELREQAAKFLETSSVKNAPWEQKKEFLLEKGLTGEEIEALVAEMERVQKEKMEEAVITKEEVKAVLEKEKRKGKGKGKQKPEEPSSSTAVEKSTTTTTSKDSDQKKNKKTATSAASPPLITYPEFLTPAPPPPPQPLVSASNMLKSAYLASAIGSTIYGAHKFIFTPMYSALTDARLDLSSTALKNLTELNTRLRELVPSTRIPHPSTTANKRHSKNYYPSPPSPSSSADGENDDDDNSSTSDPSELFHVDATTQTSPSLDYHPTSSSPETAMEDLTPDGKLEHLSTQLHALVESHSDGMDNELTFALEDLRSYLESLTYDWSSSSIFTSPYEYASIGKSGAGGGGTGGADGKKDDPVARVKAEIRSVKGVLLNTKNFPASR
ncbi:hypothetical protein L873DRAFT_1678386 [Choiromyces venosus 120613-1]|uniref:Peroxisomal membrane protein PEX14 n=1 Tax=Choiromyces venosus 120613-1 TaxID=1336337 RepID=A0A3N4JRS4_9PEZI|nr:hypothetical protein L873DRAFT_1678386 [Choiromyces venosus 120613-1]